MWLNAAGSLARPGGGDGFTLRKGFDVMKIRLLAVTLIVPCVFAVSGCCQREKPSAGKPASTAPAGEPVQETLKSEEVETTAADPLDFDDPTDLDIDVRVGAEDEGGNGPEPADDITVE